MPRSDEARAPDEEARGSEPLMTAVEVSPPSRHRWRGDAVSSYTWLPPPPTPPEDVLFRKDIEDDDVGLQAVFESLTNRQTMLFIQQALRTIIFVSFPLFTIASHPNTMYRLGFPQLLVGTVVSTSTHQGFLGKQIGMHLFILRGVVFMMLLGLFFSSWGVTRHIGAWWGLFAAAMFAANLVKHSILRRFMVLYTLIWMMEIRLSDQYFGYTTVDNSCWFAACFMIGSCAGVAALLLPFPLLMHTVVDNTFAATFAGLGKYLVTMQNFVLSPNAHAAENFFANKGPLAGVEKVLAQAPSLLWFSNWEPTEFATRNPIRVVKLSLLRRLLALTYAAHSCGTNITRLRREQADRVAMQRNRDRVRRMAGRESEREASGAGDAAVDDPLYLNARFVEDTRRVSGSAAADKLTQDLRHLHENSVEHAKAFGTALASCLSLIGTTESRPKPLVERIPFDDLIAKDTLKRRNMRVETLFVRRCQANHIHRNREQRAERARTSPGCPEPDGHAGQAATGGASKPTSEAHGTAFPVLHEPFSTREEEELKDVEPLAHPQTGSPRETQTGKRTGDADRREPYAMTAAEAAIVAEFFDVLENYEVLLRLNELFFHLLLSMIAGEMQTFGEMMRTYRPQHSLPYRLWVFFVVEPWNDFWSELWFRLTMARPCDVRTLKNAVQMTAAYLSASAFNLELWKPDNVFYFFGTTIVLGMPVGEEALTQGVTRLAGNTLGCALGYLSFHNTKNLSEMIGFTLCLCFICLVCQHHPIFGPCFIYGGIITLAGTPMAQENNDILQRTLSIAWAFCAFMLCCMLIFPSSNIKILWNHRCKEVKILSEIVDGVADVLRQPIDAVALRDDEDTASAANTDSLLSQLQLNTQLAKAMSGSCLSWGPIAARENMVRGSLPFPSGPSTEVQAGLQRLLAVTQLLVFGAQLMHRPRLTAPEPALQSVLSGSLADFLDEFAGMVRTWSQGFIDSLQNCRRWSYAEALENTSYLTRLKARLRTILFQLLALMNAPMVQGLPSLQSADIAHMNDDTLRLLTADAEAAPAGGVVVPTGCQTKADRSGERSSGVAAARDSEMHSSFASSMARDPHTSVAGRFLEARHRLGELDEAAVRSAARDGRLPNDTVVSTAGGAAYHHFAPLHDESIALRDEYPLTAQDPEGELAQAVRAKVVAEAMAREKGGDDTDTPAQPVAADLDDRATPLAARAEACESVPDVTEVPRDRPPPPVDAPHWTQNNTVLGGALHQMFQLDKSTRHYRPPPYRGPDFTYREDDLDLPVDTDFVAAVCILTSAYDMINEMQSLLTAMSTVNAYQRQLHEGSIAVDYIEGVADRIQSHRARVHARYHDPQLTLQTRPPLSSIASPFHDFAV